jgi:hypothetical protein
MSDWKCIFPGVAIKESMLEFLPLRICPFKVVVDIGFCIDNFALPLGTASWR